MSQENVEVLGASGAHRGRLIDDALRAASHWAQRTVLCPNPRISARIGRYRGLPTIVETSASSAGLRPIAALPDACLTSRRSPVRAGHRPSSRAGVERGTSARGQRTRIVPKVAVEASWTRTALLVGRFEQVNPDRTSSTSATAERARCRPVYEDFRDEYATPAYDAA